MTHATSAQAGSSDEFIFRKDFVHDAIVDLRTDLTDIDHTKLAEIQHLMETVSNSGTNAVGDSTRTTRFRHNNRPSTSCCIINTIFISHRATPKGLVYLPSINTGSLKFDSRAIAGSARI